MIPNYCFKLCIVIIFWMIRTEQDRHRKGADFLYVEIALREGVFKGKMMQMMTGYGG